MNHTEFPNNLLEAILSSPLTQNELRIALYIVRLTFGCHKESAWLIQRDLTATGIPEPQLKRLLTSMELAGILLWDKRLKTMHLNLGKLIEIESLNEERHSKNLSKNLRRRKAKSYKLDKQKLINSLSIERSFVAKESQKVDPKENKEIIKKANIEEGGGYKAFKELREKQKNSNSF